MLSLLQKTFKVYSKIFIYIIFNTQSKRVFKKPRICIWKDEGMEKFRSRIRDSNINYAILSQVFVSPKGSIHLGEMPTSANDAN